MADSTWKKTSSGFRRVKKRQPKAEELSTGSLENNDEFFLNDPEVVREAGGEVKPTLFGPDKIISRPGDGLSKSLEDVDPSSMNLGLWDKASDIKTTTRTGKSDDLSSRFDYNANIAEQESIRKDAEAKAQISGAALDGASDMPLGNYAPEINIPPAKISAGLGKIEDNALNQVAGLGDISQSAPGISPDLKQDSKKTILYGKNKGLVNDSDFPDLVNQKTGDVIKGGEGLYTRNTFPSIEEMRDKGLEGIPGTEVMQYNEEGYPVQVFRGYAPTLAVEAMKARNQEREAEDEATRPTYTDQYGNKVKGFSRQEILDSVEAGEMTRADANRMLMDNRRNLEGLPGIDWRAIDQRKDEISQAIFEGQGLDSPTLASGETVFQRLNNMRFDTSLNGKPEGANAVLDAISAADLNIDADIPPELQKELIGLAKDLNSFMDNKRERAEARLGAIIAQVQNDRERRERTLENLNLESDTIEADLKIEGGKLSQLGKEYMNTGDIEIARQYADKVERMSLLELIGNREDAMKNIESYVTTMNTLLGDQYDRLVKELEDLDPESPRGMEVADEISTYETLIRENRQKLTDAFNKYNKKPDWALNQRSSEGLPKGTPEGTPEGTGLPQADSDFEIQYNNAINDIQNQDEERLNNFLNRIDQDGSFLNMVSGLPQAEIENTLNELEKALMSNDAYNESEGLQDKFNKLKENVNAGNVIAEESKTTPGYTGTKNLIDANYRASINKGNYKDSKQSFPDYYQAFSNGNMDNEYIQNAEDYIGNEITDSEGRFIYGNARENKYYNVDGSLFLSPEQFIFFNQGIYGPENVRYLKVGANIKLDENQNLDYDSFSANPRILNKEKDEYNDTINDAIKYAKGWNTNKRMPWIQQITSQVNSAQSKIQIDKDDRLNGLRKQAAWLHIVTEKTIDNLMIEWNSAKGEEKKELMKSMNHVLGLQETDTLSPDEEIFINRRKALNNAYALVWMNKHPLLKDYKDGPLPKLYEITKGL